MRLMEWIRSAQRKVTEDNNKGVKVMKNALRVSMVLSVLAALLLLSTAVFAQDKKEETAEKKYAAIVGEYEFDLSEFSQPNQTVRVYVEENALMIEGEDGDPDEMEAVEGEEFTFTVEDPEQGTLTFTFLKDDEDKYNLVTVEVMGFEISGTRIGDGK